MFTILVFFFVSIFFDNRFFGWLLFVIFKMLIFPLLLIIAHELVMIGPDLFDDLLGIDSLLFLLICNSMRFVQLFAIKELFLLFSESVNMLAGQSAMFSYLLIDVNGGDFSSFLEIKYFLCDSFFLFYGLMKFDGIFIILERWFSLEYDRRKIDSGFRLVFELFDKIGPLLGEGFDFGMIKRLVGVISHGMK